MAFRTEDIRQSIEQDVKLLKKSAQRHIVSRGKVKLPTGMVGNRDERNFTASPTSVQITNLPKNVSIIYKF